MCCCEAWLWLNGVLGGLKLDLRLAELGWRGKGRLGSFLPSQFRHLSIHRISKTSFFNLKDRDAHSKTAALHDLPGHVSSGGRHATPLANRPGLTRRWTKITASPDSSTGWIKSVLVVDTGGTTEPYMLEAFCLLEGLSPTQQQ